MRVRVERIFGTHANDMGGTIVRTIGLVRAKAKIGINDKVWVHRLAPRFGAGARSQHPVRIGPLRHRQIGVRPDAPAPGPQKFIGTVECPVWFIQARPARPKVPNWPDLGSGRHCKTPGAMTSGSPALSARAMGQPLCAVGSQFRQRAGFVGRDVR